MNCNRIRLTADGKLRYCLFAIEEDDVKGLMRSGAPDSLDRMVATSYANLAMDLILKRDTGFMVSLQSGVYTAVPMDVISRGPKRVDIEELYDAQDYQPKVAHQMGKPMFLY